MTKVEPRSILPTSTGKRRTAELERFAEFMKQLSADSPYQWSSRGWCYVMENLGVITKGEFDRVEGIINECRKKGILPIDFTTPDDSRAFEGLVTPSTKSPTENFVELLRYTIDGIGFSPDYWQGEEYYIEMLVEKKDLKTLFQPVCEEYHIPIANSRGSSDINTRAAMAWRFQKAENLGLTPVLLVCGDFDPYGLLITDVLHKNFVQIEKGTGWYPETLVVDRFGLNLDFIQANNLTWIDNLISGSERNMANDYGRNPIITKYIDAYGVRKCEANALVVAHQQGVELCRNAIERWLGKDARDRINAKDEAVKKKIAEFLESNNAR